MGLFDIFKKKHTTRHVTNKNDAERVVSSSEKADDLGEIANILVSSEVISGKVEKGKNSFGEDLQRLTPNGELPFGWVAYYKDFVDEQNQKIDALWRDVYTATTTTKKIEAYRKYFDEISHIAVLCKESGECHFKWFCENIIETQWYNKQFAEYQELKQQAPELIKREELLKNIGPEVMRKIVENDGILQTDLIKMFDPIIKDDISKLLRNLEQGNVITREKSGRTYKIYKSKPPAKPGA